MTDTRISVFVRSITDTSHGAIVVEASNGKPEGPPFVRFNIPAKDMKKCHIGKRYVLTIEDGEDG